MPSQVSRKAPGSAVIDKKQICQLADAMLKRIGLEPCELSILLTNDLQIQRLNRQYRNQDRPTDVLSFHFDARLESRQFSGPRFLGDIVVSIDTALRQARVRRRALIAELRWLIAHGLLHLVGWDHTDPEQKRKMVAWTRKLVNSAPLPSSALAPRARQPRRPPHDVARQPRGSRQLSNPSSPRGRPRSRLALG